MSDLQSNNCLFQYISKLSDRCLCYFTAAMFVPLPRAQAWRFHTILKALNICVTILQITRENEKQQKPGSWRDCLPISHLSYPRFLTLFIVWLRFSVLITWLVKTENRWHMVSIPIKIEFDYPKRNCVTTVWIYKGLYGNATVLLEKSILLMFCEKKSTLAVLYSMLFATPAPNATSRPGCPVAQWTTWSFSAPIFPWLSGYHHDI